MAVSLKAHLLLLLKERDRRYEQRFRAQQRATDKAEADLRARLALLNELRGNVATKDQTAEIERRLTEMAARIDKNEGHDAGSVAGWARMVAVAVIVSAIVAGLAVFLRHG